MSTVYVNAEKEVFDKLVNVFKKHDLIREDLVEARQNDKSPLVILCRRYAGIKNLKENQILVENNHWNVQAVVEDYKFFLPNLAFDKNGQIKNHESIWTTTRQMIMSFIDTFKPKLGYQVLFLNWSKL